MKQHKLKQGSPEWRDHRANHFNASDAPAMLGCSDYTSRSDLIREMVSGQKPEVDAATQKRFDDGHRFEALARPLAEQIVGDDLAPSVGTEGKLSASFDGLTFMNDIAFEHKVLNNKLRNCMVEGGTGADLPKMYRLQMEQQHMVSGCEKVLFMASKWERVDAPSEDGRTYGSVIGDGGEEIHYVLIEERHCWYTPDHELREEIVHGWVQLADDIANYQHIEVKAESTGVEPDALPALRIEVTGMVTASNLEAFKDHALAVFKDINAAVLVTDEDFSNAKKTVKWCAEVATRLKAAKQHALSQTESIDALFRAIDSIIAVADKTRLDFDKRVKADEQVQIAVIRKDAEQAFGEYIDAINAKLRPVSLPIIDPDFIGAMRNLKSMKSRTEACADRLAAKKIEAKQAAALIQANLTFFEEVVGDHKSLFADLQAIITKPPQDFSALVKVRIADHKAAEQAKEDALREKIRAEEEAKAKEAQAEPVAAVGFVAARSSAPAKQTAATKRPTDKEIILAMCASFDEQPNTVIEWLKAMDFSSDEIKAEPETATPIGISYLDLLDGGQLPAPPASKQH